MKSGYTSNPFFYVFVLLFAMLSIQSGATLAKILFARLNPEGVTTLRLVFATLILCLIVRPWTAKITWAQVKQIAPYGIVLGAMNLTFYIALQRIPLGIAVALEFIGPLGVALYLSRSFKDLIWVTFAVVGIGLFLPLGDSVAAPLDLTGVIFALLAGVCWGLYIIFGQKAGVGLSSGVVATLGMGFATLTVLPFGIYFAGSALLDVSLWPIGLAVGVFSGALPYTLEMVALKKLPRKTFSVLMSLEPSIAALSGLVFLKELLTPLQCLAIALVIVASIGTTLSVKKAVQEIDDKKVPPLID